MIEAENQPMANPAGDTAPRFEPLPDDDYRQYLLHSQPEILSVLRSLIQKNALITIHLDAGRSFLLSALVALSDDNRHLILDVGGDETMNRKALAAVKPVLTTLVDKVKVQFSLEQLSATQYQGRPAFVAAVPEKLLRLQRREFFRLATPVANPVKLTTTLTLGDQRRHPVEIPLLDISGGGVGLMFAHELLPHIRRGDTLENCRIQLAGEGLLACTLYVRNLFEVATRSGSRFVRGGCEFADFTPQKLTLVQHYITRIERERKARLSGLG
ncbi:flagellar brake protein [Propionivibrio limicola]|uniref:flagellar brake protein n=1 Tax=Propionivibrio limicola TaxID=167645 RepID=UPI001B868D34|nr:flagellar brake protein [Propionivibrio limicola]